MYFEYLKVSCLLCCCHLTHCVFKSCELLSFFRLHFIIWNKIVVCMHVLCGCHCVSFSSKDKLLEITLLFYSCNGSLQEQMHVIWMRPSFQLILTLNNETILSIKVLSKLSIKRSRRAPPSGT